MWPRTWRPAIGPKNTIVDVGSIAPNQDGASAVGSAATSIITAERTGETVSGTLLASILVKDAGGYATCTARGVRFAVSQPR